MSQICVIIRRVIKGLHCITFTTIIDQQLIRFSVFIIGRGVGEF